MSVIEELENKIDFYLNEQPSEVQDNFDDIESIKNKIDFKIYLAQKLIDIGIEIEDDETIIDYNYISKNNYTLSIDTNIKLSYKNKPFLIINTDVDSFKLNNFSDEENIYYTSLLLALNQNWDELNHTHDLWFFIPHCQVDENNLEPFVQFVLLINGKVFHSPIEIENSQLLKDEVKNILECTTKNFNQYQESAYILSEYNHTKDILLKYLLLYHIIENFMYRRPIAEMAATKFTIRQFKILYENVKESEQKTLKDLLEKIKNLQVPPSTSIEAYFQTNLTSFKATLSAPQIATLSTLLQKMGVQHVNGLLYKNASQLIYLFRNSIIHNKETEFHITHTTLNENQELVDFFSKFLLPTLENIIYILIFQPNSLIDYPQNHILLYGENYDCQRTIHETLPSPERDRTTIFHRFKSKLSECRELVSSWRQ